MSWGNDAAVVVALVLLGVVGAIAFSYYREQVMERRLLIAEAAGLFDRHFKAVETLMADPATPDLLKGFVADFSIGINDDRVARSLSELFLSKKPPANHNRSSQLIEVLDAFEKLHTHREDLTRAIYVATFAGVQAMILRASARDKNIRQALKLAAKLPEPRQRDATKDIIERVLGGGVPNGCGPIPA